MPLLDRDCKEAVFDLRKNDQAPAARKLLEPFFLLESDGEKYHNVTFSAGLPFSRKSNSANCADFFRDGRLSIIIAAGGAYPGDLLTASVYRPTTLNGNYGGLNWHHTSRWVP